MRKHAHSRAHCAGTGALLPLPPTTPWWKRHELHSPRDGHFGTLPGQMAALGDFASGDEEEGEEKGSPVDGLLRSSTMPAIAAAADEEEMSV